MLSLRPGARRFCCLSVLPTLCLALCSSLALAQNGGTIRGEVHDPDARVMPNAQVELRNSATGATLRTRTTAAGQYSFVSLPTGTYDVLVPPDGFTLAPFARAGVRVEPGRPLPSISDCNGEVISALPVMINRAFTLGSPIHLRGPRLAHVKENLTLPACGSAHCPNESRGAMGSLRSPRYCRGRKRW